MRRLPVIAFGYLAIVGCNRTDQASMGVEISEASAQAVEEKSAPVPVDQAMTVRICKAAIAKLFAHPNTIINAKPNGNGIIRTSYRRPSDNTLWKNDCKLEGNRVVWRSVDAFPGLGPGRWRTGEYDGVVTYSIVDGEVVVEEKL